MIHKLSRTIRFSEIDQDAYLSMPAMMNCLQDSGIQHGQDTGITLEYLMENKEGWVLAAIQIDIIEMPKYNEKVDVYTWAYGFHHCLGTRNFKLESPEGKEYLVADSQWVYMDLSKPAMKEVPDWIIRAYGDEKQAKLEHEFLPRKIKTAEDAQMLPSFTVDTFMLDTNKHVNNARYFKLAMGCIPEPIRPKRFRAEYRKQGHLGDVFVPYVAKLDKGYQVRLEGEDGALYFIGEWII